MESIITPRMVNVRIILSHLAVLAFAGVLFFLQGPSFVRHPADRVADEGDSILNAWILAWDAHALRDPSARVWDAPIFYPAKNTFAFSETMFGNLWITLPVQYLTGNPVLAFNALVFASFVLGMYGTFLLTRCLTGSFAAGVTAGILFSFNPFRWSEIPHVQLLLFFWAPLALLACHRFLETRGRWAFAGMALALLAQTYASIYLGIILFMTLLVFAAVFLIREVPRGERWRFLADRRLFVPVLVWGVLGLLALLPVGLPYLRSVQDWNFVRSESENASFSCEILSFLVPNGSFRAYRWWQNLWGNRIHGCYGLGLAPWGLALAALFLARRDRSFYSDARRRVLQRLAWTALVMAIFMMGPYVIFLDHKTDIPLPYLLVYHIVPGAKAMRVPARYVFPLLLCLSVLSGFATAHLLSLWRRWRPGYRVAAGLLGVSLCCLDYAVTDDAGVRLETRGAFPPVYDYLARSRNGLSILELPADWQRQFRYLHYQTAHWRPLLGGETGSYPPAILEMTKRLHGPPTEASLRFLGLTPAMTVVIHLDRYDAATAAAWRQADLGPLGFRSAGQWGDAVVWEREEPPRCASRALCVVRPMLEHSKGFLQDAVTVSAMLTPAERDMPWRCLERGVSALEIVLTDVAGNDYRYEKTIEVPPYLLAGETVPAKIGRLRGAPKDVRRIRVRGPLIEEFVEEVISP